MKENVFGFLISKDRRKVFIVTGFTKENETPLTAIYREFEERTGYIVEPWQEFAYFNNVHCFRAFIDNLPMEGFKPLRIMFTGPMYMRWLIPLALDYGIIHAEIFIK